MMLAAVMWMVERTAALMLSGMEKMIGIDLGAGVDDDDDDVVSPSPMF